jgi:RND family efflux transporter MFP subunit
MVITSAASTSTIALLRGLLLLAILLCPASFAEKFSPETQVHLQGIVMPAQKIKMSFAQSGMITEMAGNGSLVNVGQVIAKIDDKKARAQLQQSAAEHRLAKSELASVTHDRDKSARLVAENILSDVALLEAEFSVAIAQERLIVALSQLTLAQTALAECVVLAPFKGAVVEKNAGVGEWMNAGDPFIEFVNLAVLSLSIDIPPEMALGLSLGQVTHVLDRGQVVGQAKVTNIFPIIDPASGLRRIIWQVMPRDNTLLTGRYVSLASWSQTPSSGAANKESK